MAHTELLRVPAFIIERLKGERERDALHLVAELSQKLDQAFAEYCTLAIAHQRLKKAWDAASNASQPHLNALIVLLGQHMSAGNSMRNRILLTMRHISASFVDKKQQLERFADVNTSLAQELREEGVERLSGQKQAAAVVEREVSLRLSFLLSGQSLPRLMPLECFLESVLEKEEGTGTPGASFVPDEGPPGAPVRAAVASVCEMEVPWQLPSAASPGTARQEERTGEMGLGVDPGAAVGASNAPPLDVERRAGERTCGEEEVARAPHDGAVLGSDARGLDAGGHTHTSPKVAEGVDNMGDGARNEMPGAIPEVELNCNEMLGVGGPSDNKSFSWPLTDLLMRDSFKSAKGASSPPRPCSQESVEAGCGRSMDYYASGMIQSQIP